MACGCQKISGMKKRKAKKINGMMDNADYTGAIDFGGVALGAFGAQYFKPDLVEAIKSDDDTEEDLTTKKRIINGVGILLGIGTAVMIDKDADEGLRFVRGIGIGVGAQCAVALAADYMRADGEAMPTVGKNGWNSVAYKQHKEKLLREKGYRVAGADNASPGLLGSFRVAGADNSSPGLLGSFLKASTSSAYGV